MRKNENTWTQGREYYTLGSIGGNRRGTAKRGSWGGIAWGEMPNVGEGEEGSKTHCVYLCNCLACSAHVPQNLKCNKKKLPEKKNKLIKKK